MNMAITTIEILSQLFVMLQNNLPGTKSEALI